MSDKKKETQGAAENQKLSTKENILQTVKFALFSASAGIIQIATYTLFYEACHFKEWIAYLISLVLSVLWNFTFNRKFTFKSAANVPIAMAKVLTYYTVFTPLSTLLGEYLAGTLGWDEYLVTAINMLLNFETEFLYQRTFVFGKSLDTGK